MKTSRARAVALSAVAFLAASIAQAHPGHDGHELTWDLSHLAAYPVATFVCFAVFGAGVAGGWLMLRRAATLRVQSLRKSQPSRGK
jgi:hypothetical protein